MISLRNQRNLLLIRRRDPIFTLDDLHSYADLRGRGTNPSRAFWMEADPFIALPQAMNMLLNFWAEYPPTGSTSLYLCRTSLVLEEEEDVQETQGVTNIVTVSTEALTSGLQRNMIQEFLSSLNVRNIYLQDHERVYHPSLHQALESCSNLAKLILDFTEPFSNTDVPKLDTFFQQLTVKIPKIHCRIHSLDNALMMFAGTANMIHELELDIVLQQSSSSDTTLNCRSLQSLYDFLENTTISTLGIVIHETTRDLLASHVMPLINEWESCLQDAATRNAQLDSFHLQVVQEDGSNSSVLIDLDSDLLRQLRQIPLQANDGEDDLEVEEHIEPPPETGSFSFLEVDVNMEPRFRSTSNVSDL